MRAHGGALSVRRDGNRIARSGLRLGIGANAGSLHLHLMYTRATILTTIDTLSTDTPIEPTVLILMMVTPENEVMVRAYVTTLSGNPSAVDDLSQEVFVRAIERADRVRDPANPGPFLRGIARHVVQEYFRQRKQWHFAALAADSMVDATEVSETVFEHEQLDALAIAISELPLVSRRMLEMRYAQGLNATQIGHELDIKPTAVRVTLLRIRERLKQQIKGD